MRPPPRSSTTKTRSHGAVPPSRTNRTSSTITSAESIADGSKRKRKGRDFEYDDRGTNISVVVRCRGRNHREVQENSGIVLQTEGVKGKYLELLMGSAALSNKTYRFDKVFSSAADQCMIYDDVVTPILDEMLAGYNCTIFAYGQTGTGKTYTMSGDMNDQFGMLSDNAGIIPRTLHALFTKLEITGVESSVKVSFIELYNEELRDLVAPDDNVQLKIYEDHSKKIHTNTLVQGMEELHINNAKDGIKILQDGSLKRQVAATKCNDLSSRSHTIFTITVHIKRTAENGEDYISAGKLNLVDLAGSENIQRSGAENKRAVEAGLINKSLLTLGRVINALVERSSRDIHIPYRESKLTRLLQDSLGGQTKTCIIATVAPSKSNLDETISTLDYAFRAKNIRNKPQINSVIEKKTLLKEFTEEIQKLKSELIAARQRNGVYLTNESYEEMTVQSESQRILSEEQAAKIEIMESNLRNKVQELYSLTSNFMALKKKNESTNAILDKTKIGLEQTEMVLAKARQSLAEESLLRRAHQNTEAQLKTIGEELISTLNKTVEDVDGLHAKNGRISDLHVLNRNNWGLSQTHVSNVTTLLETRVDDLKVHQQNLVTSMTDNVQSFVRSEMNKLASTQKFLEHKVADFESSKTEISSQTKSAEEEIDTLLENIKVLCEDVETQFGKGLESLSVDAKRISSEVVSELGDFHNQLHESYSSLGRDLQSSFEELVRYIDAQKSEVNDLRQQFNTASEVTVQSNADVLMQLENVLREEREQAAVDRQNLLSKIQDMITEQGAVQDQRLGKKISEVRTTINSSRDSFEAARKHYSQGMEAWNENETKLANEALRLGETLKSKLEGDWLAADKHNLSMQGAISSVHNKTVRTLDEQTKNTASQMQTLHDYVTKVQLQHSRHYNQHTKGLEGLCNTVKASYTNIGTYFDSTYKGVMDLGDEMLGRHISSQDNLASVNDMLRQPLADLRANISNANLRDYQPTGQTPQKVPYLYQTELPQTEHHEALLAALRGRIISDSSIITSPSKPCKSSTTVFHDARSNNIGETSWSLTQTSPLGEIPIAAGGLREIDANINSGNSISPDVAANHLTTDSSLVSLSPVTKFKRRKVTSRRSLMPTLGQKNAAHVSAEGRKNLPPSALSPNVGWRRSPRMS